MHSITISKNGRKRLLSGHPWIFASDIEQAPAMTPGSTVDIHGPDGRFLGRGYFNPRSQISLRVLTRVDEPIDRAFWAARVDRAIAYRSTLGVLDCCRLIHGESDGFPALIVDKFADVLVMQSLSAGMDAWKETIADILMEKLPVRGIYERSEAPVRRREGLGNAAGYLRGDFVPHVQVRENNILLEVDVARGQKTGYFLDQRENRAALAPYVKDARVLDCFCHIGSFSLHAAQYGARETLGLDISPEAVQRAAYLAQLNGFSQCRFEACNAFDRLRELDKAGETFDCVVLDPPAFAKDRRALPSALRGYKEINLRGMRITRRGGYLVTCSCSQHVLPPAFLDMLRAAAADAGRDLRQVEVRGQAKDHPSLLAAPETNYLKCVILQVL